MWHSGTDACVRQVVFFVFVLSYGACVPCITLCCMSPVTFCHPTAMTARAIATALQPPLQQCVIQRHRPPAKSTHKTPHPMLLHIRHLREAALCTLPMAPFSWGIGGGQEWPPPMSCQWCRSGRGLCYVACSAVQQTSEEPQFNQKQEEVAVSEQVFHFCIVHCVLL